MSGSADLDAPETGGVVESAVDAVREVAVTLSAEQVQAVVRQATGRAALGEAFADVLADPEALTSFLRPLLGDNAYSRSVLRALIILAGFPADGSEREVTAVAGEVGFAPATTYRYLHTLTAAGLLERDTASRRYRRPRLAAASMTADHRIDADARGMRAGGRASTR
jgi:uncharacterized membrane protein (DUF4010 family)